MASVPEYAPYLAAAYLAFVLGLLSPGPNVIAIIGTSMGTSRLAGVSMACGIATGSVIWATMGVFGLTALLAGFAWFGTVLRIVGGCYLLWLGWGYLKAARQGGRIAVEERAVRARAGRLFAQGLGIQMTNPKAVLFWLSVMSLVVRPDMPLWVAVATVAGIGILSFIGHLSWAVLFSTRGIVTVYQRIKRLADGLLGSLFAALGIGLLASVVRHGSKA